MIKNIQKVTGFLGTTGTPVPVSDKEIDKILGRIKEGTLAPKKLLLILENKLRYVKDLLLLLVV